MINPATYTAEWIESVSRSLNNADRILVEKVIRALTLLTELKNHKLDFIFRGGLHYYSYSPSLPVCQ